MSLSKRDATVYSDANLHQMPQKHHDLNCAMQLLCLHTFLKSPYQMCEVALFEGSLSYNLSNSVNNILTTNKCVCNNEQSFSDSQVIMKYLKQR